MKNIYLRVTEINERWSQRMLRGFHKCMDEIREISRRGSLSLHNFQDPMGDITHNLKKWPYSVLALKPGCKLFIDVTNKLLTIESVRKHGNRL